MGVSEEGRRRGDVQGRAWEHAGTKYCFLLERGQRRQGAGGKRQKEGVESISEDKEKLIFERLNAE